jgi:hypothetical protein
MSAYFGDVEDAEFEEVRDSSSSITPRLLARFIGQDSSDNSPLLPPISISPTGITETPTGAAAPTFTTSQAVFLAIGAAAAGICIYYLATKR